MTFMYDDILIKDISKNHVYSAYKPNFQQYYVIDGKVKVKVSEVNEKLSSGEWIKIEEDN